jgi:hypothetical protein
MTFFRCIGAVADYISVMKPNFNLHALALFFALVAGLSVNAQKEEPRALFDSLALSGGFFSFDLRYTEVMGTNAVLMGFGMGIVVNDNLNIGLAGAFNTSTIKNDRYERFLNDSLQVNTGGGLELNYGYGGLLLERVFFPRSPVHFSIPVLIGLGGVNYGYPLPNSDSENRNKVAGQAFFALEPGLQIEATIIRKFRIGLGASYLYTSDLDLPETSPDALRTLMYRLTLRYAAP